MNKPARPRSGGRARGTLGEELAVEYLIEKGYQILDRNFRFERGEIDIVAEEKGVLVFVEVKTRHSKSVGDPEDAVTIAKRDKIRKVAEGYLFEHHVEDRECRFDVVAIERESPQVHIRHIENAF